MATSQVGVTSKNGQKRIVVQPLAPIGGDSNRPPASSSPASQVGVTSKNGKKRIVVQPLAPIGSGVTPTAPTKPMGVTFVPPSATECPSGCVPEKVCQQRIADALREHGSLPSASKGQEQYYDYIDKMEETYSKMGPIGEDEDILFDNTGFVKPTKKKKDVAPKKAKGCARYSNEKLRCLANACKYSDATKKCSGSMPSKKVRPGVLHDDDRKRVSFTHKPKAPRTSKLPSAHKASPKEYKAARAAALEKELLEFMVGGEKYSRKTTKAKRFSKTKR